MKYRIVTEETYQALLNSSKAIATHIEAGSRQGKSIAPEFAKVKETWKLVQDLASGDYPDFLLPPSLPDGTPVIVSSKVSLNFPDSYTMMMAIQAYPGVVVRPPEDNEHAGYHTWGMVDAYAASKGDRAYRGEWVLKRFADSPDYEGAHFWAYRFTYEEMMRRRAGLIAVEA